MSQLMSLLLFSAPQLLAPTTMPKQPRSLPPAVSQNLIRLPVPSSQSDVRVCLTNSRNPAQPPLSIPPSCCTPAAPQGLAKDVFFCCCFFCTDLNENLFNISAALVSYHIMLTLWSDALRTSLNLNPYLSS